MSLKAAVTLSRAVGASLRPLLAVRSVGAEFAAAPALWPPPHAPKPPQAPSLVRHTSSVAGAAAEGPREAIEELRSTKWWEKTPQKKREKLLVALAELEQAEGEVPLEIALSALKKLKAPPDVNVVQALVSSGFITQVDFGIRFENESTEKQNSFLASIFDMPIDVSLELAQEGELISSIGVKFENRVTQVWVRKLPTYLSDAKAELLKIETKLAKMVAKMEAQEAIKSEVLTCKKSAGDELWEILKRCGVVRVSMKMMQGTTKAEDRVKVLKSLCSYSVDSLAKCDIDAFCKEELPEHVSASMMADFKAQLEVAARTAWFNSQARELSIMNLGVPLRSMLLLKKRGKDAAKKQLKDAGVGDKQYIQGLLNTDDSTLEILADNFGWLLDAGDAFVGAEISQWSVADALKDGLTKAKCEDPTASEGKNIKWTAGCSPIYMNGILEAVVLRLPIWLEQPYKFQHDKTGLNRVSFGGLKVQGLRPTVFGVRSEASSSSLEQDLMLTTFVLTRGRMRLFEKSAKTCFGALPGVMATAAHGTGKSASLRALATMIGIGAGGDVLYMSESNAFAPSKPAFENLFHNLMQGGLSMSCGNSLLRPQVCMDMAAIGKEGARAHEALHSLLIAQDSAYNRGGEAKGKNPKNLPASFIVDEAHHLQAVLDKRPSEDPLWWKELNELFIWTKNSSRVFAYSPDFHAAHLDLKKDKSKEGKEGKDGAGGSSGTDEGDDTKRSKGKADSSDEGNGKGTEKKKVLEPIEFRFDFGSSTDEDIPFFEMERLSPELSRLLMLGPKRNADALGWTEQVHTVADLQPGQDCSLQLPPRAMRALSDADNLKLFDNFVLSVGGLARALTRAVARTKASSSIDTDWFQVALKAAWGDMRQQMENRCLKRLKEGTLETTEEEKGVKLFLSHTMAAASILSRIDPNKMTLEGNVRFSSHVARHAYIRSLLSLHRKLAGPKASLSQKRAWDRIMNSVTHLGSGEDFGDTVATLLELGMFGSSYKKLSSMPSRPPKVVLRTYSLGSDPGSILAAQTKQEAKGAGLSAADVHVVQNLAPGSVHVVRTPHNFPAVDFVVFRRSTVSRDEDNTVPEPSKLQVAFIETTISTLAGHASKRTLDNLRVTRLGEKPKKKVPPTLADLANLACDEGYLRKIQGTQMKFDNPKETEETKATLANLILWTFGVPIDLNCRVVYDHSGDFKELLMEPKLLPEEDRDAVMEMTKQLLVSPPSETGRKKSRKQPETGTEVGEDEAEEPVAPQSVAGEVAAAFGQGHESPPLPLSELITEVKDVELFFIYCTRTPQGKSHALSKAYVPGFYGVFEQNFLPPELKPLGKKMGDPQEELDAER